MSDEVIDLRPWGYAIGNYMRPAGCAACGCDLRNVDKYASSCCPCAYAAREKHIAEQAAKPVEASAKDFRLFRHITMAIQRMGEGRWEDAQVNIEYARLILIDKAGRYPPNLDLGEDGNFS